MKRKYSTNYGMIPYDITLIKIYKPNFCNMAIIFYDPL